jgi:hypothetical protein
MQELRETGMRACQALLIAGMMTMTSQAGAQTAPAPRPVGRVSTDQAQARLHRQRGGRGWHAALPRALLSIHDQWSRHGCIGTSKITGTGEVYQLARVSDLEGVYGQVRRGWALANQGGGRLWLQNVKGVVLRLRTKREGLMLAAGADAVRIQLR